MDIGGNLGFTEVCERHLKYQNKLNLSAIAFWLLQ